MYEVCKQYFALE
jgi:hypothetical protein